MGIKLKEEIPGIGNMRQAKIYFMKDAKLEDEITKEEYCHQWTEGSKGIKETNSVDGRKLA